MNATEAQKLVSTDPEFVNLKRFNFRLSEVLERYPDGCPDRVIANALMIAEADVEELYLTAIAKLRMIMGVDC